MMKHALTENERKNSTTITMALITLIMVLVRVIFMMMIRMMDKVVDFQEKGRTPY